MFAETRIRPGHSWRRRHQVQECHHIFKRDIMKSKPGEEDSTGLDSVVDDSGSGGHSVGGRLGHLCN